MSNQPTPGSDAAIKLGCTCPVLDNGHGRRSDGNYVFTAGCPVHDTRKKLVLFNCCDTKGHDPEDGLWRLIWARNQAEALILYRLEWYAENGYASDWSVYAEPVKFLAGNHEPKYSRPHVESRTSVERDAGWMIEGDERCERCERASMNGKFPVCDVCYLCEECAKAAGDKCSFCGKGEEE